MVIKFEGLEELLKEVERVGSSAAISKANSEILKKCGEKARDVARTKMPKSENPMKSGKRGSRTGKHSADVLPLSRIKNKKGYQSILVGWDKSDNSPYFYTKFTEWGTTKIRPIAYMEKTKQELTKYFSEVAEKEYKKLISDLK